MIPYLPPDPTYSPRLRTHPPFDHGSRRRRKAGVRIGLASLGVAAALAGTAAKADAATTAKLSGGTLTVHGDDTLNARGGQDAVSGVAGLILPEVDLGAGD